MKFTYTLAALCLSSFALLHAAPQDSIPAAEPLEQAVVMPTITTQASESTTPPPHWPKPEKWEPFKVRASVQSDLLYSLSRDPDYQKLLGNSYISAKVGNNWLEFGTRLEELSMPLPGRKNEQGRGFPHFYLSGRYGTRAELTVGDFYEQFGSGILFRAYEERTLGIDNAVRGAKLTLNPYTGIYLKGMVGQQRYYFDRNFRLFAPNRGFISGADVELQVDSWIKAMQQKRVALSLGASFVNKQEPDEEVQFVRDGKTYRLNLPLQVPALGTRVRLGIGNVVINAEYAYKPNDPTAVNNYIYKPGSVVMLSTAYSQKGMSLLLQAKRSENFNFLSKRSMLGTPLHINHLPAFTNTHTYTLAALYPYATQPQGEWAFQGEWRYNIPRKTALGGKYGTGIKLNYAHVRGLKQNFLPEVDPIDPTSFYGTDGYNAPFFGMGELYFSDFDVEITKKLTKDFSFIFSYMHQIYNQRVVEGHAINNDLVWSNIFIMDAKYRLNRKMTLRGELQYLACRQAEGDWLYAMAELSLLPSFMFSVSDQYNAGTTKEHYYMASATYSKGNSRFAISYGRTRAGMNCSGGVCRWMPQTKGIYLSYSANF